VTPYLEIGGDYREVLPSVHLLELPLPFSMGLVNVFLVRLDDGFLLIDSGMDTEPCFAALDRAREGIGFEWSDIRQVLLTHMHPDHIGLAKRLVELSGATLLMHNVDVQLLDKMSTGTPRQSWVEGVLKDAGVPVGVMAQVECAFAEIQKSFRKLQPDCTLSGGEVLNTSIGELQVIWTPGHSPGHVCLYCPERRVLFSGDHMLEHISPNIGWQPDHDALGEFLDSLDRIDPLEIDVILPSHGGPFTGHREWIRKTIEHHKQRCDRIVSSLSKRPKTAHELVEELWDRQLSPFHYRFAIFEILAHLDFLARRDRLASCRQNGASVWQLVDETIRLRQ
jgi:glyoxylase-like metal-dependent hydrolase (beta-lactamase superfamily II)